MPKSIEYTGTVRGWSELPFTGRQSTWFPGQIEQRSDTEAAALLATGQFSDVDATQLPESKVVAISGVVSGDGIPGGAHPRYLCHCYAGNQLPTDAFFYDRSGAGRHISPGVDSSAAEMWAIPGWARTLDPTTTVGQRLRAMTMPGLSFDYAGGESLMLWALAQATPKAAATNLLGSYDASASQSGIRWRVSPTGKLAVALYDGPTATLRTFSDSALTAFEAGVPHAIGVYFDGQNFRGHSWIDGTIQSNNASIPPVNTLPSAAQVAAGLDRLRLGADTSTTGAADRGLATQWRAIVALKWGANDAIPTPAQVQAAMQALQAAPDRLILRGAL